MYNDKGIMDKICCLIVDITIMYRYKDFKYETYDLKN